MSQTTTTTAPTLVLSSTSPNASKKDASKEDTPKQDACLQGVARGDRQGVLKLRGIPTFTDPFAKRQWIREHMAAAFRFFGRNGYTEGTSGHISVRDPVLPNHFWMNPFAVHFNQLKASDMVLVDAGGYVVEGGNQAMINEAGFMIHSAVHEARPEVISVVHAHSIHGKAWASFGKPIEMLNQDACNVFGKLGVYEDHGGIALAKDEGRAIAKALGPTNAACILQNHGLITCGTTVDEAAFLFYNLDQSCKAQLMAEAAAANGLEKKYIPDDVAQYTASSMQSADNFYNEFQPEFNYVVYESKGEVLQ
ncbi:hypothetical protein NM208_g5835 [Fusarium decemcellulare]|uniref:Uncharacterized protein n=1 Tax=Fusarium decemcellulare TaxID=57161 RepID=A0ACC1SFN5_9HYPO|nr:hypothetical protein NM208_g5835 [Fusarium decemcellulare]